MLGEGVCAALGGTHATFVGGSEACIPKRDDSSEVATSLYRNEYYIETILSSRFWGEHSLLLFYLFTEAVNHLERVIQIMLIVSIVHTQFNSQVLCLLQGFSLDFNKATHLSCLRNAEGFHIGLN